MKKNMKSVVLCLLEVARRGARFGMEAPLLVQMEREIDRDIAKDRGERYVWILNNNIRKWKCRKWRVEKKAKMHACQNLVPSNQGSKVDCSGNYSLSIFLITLFLHKVFFFKVFHRGSFRKQLATSVDRFLRFDTPSKINIALFLFASESFIFTSVLESRSKNSSPGSRLNQNFNIFYRPLSSKRLCVR